MWERYVVASDQVAACEQPRTISSAYRMPHGNRKRAKSTCAWWPAGVSKRTTVSCDGVGRTRWTLSAGCSRRRSRPRGFPRADAPPRARDTWRPLTPTFVLLDRPDCGNGTNAPLRRMAARCKTVGQLAFAGGQLNPPRVHRVACSGRTSAAPCRETKMRA